MRKSKMDYWFLMAAAAISLVGMVFHGFIGGKIYISNVNNSDMETLTKSLSIVSWHVFTIFLFVSASSLICIAYNPEFAIAAYPIIGINFLGSLLFVYLGLGRHRALLRMPGAFLTGTTALLAWLGI
ncbi:hypothetical protein N9I23_05130 [Porticoccaceae bacterium]|nr:hypothetical protein [Porticoccaceae bacterium]